MLPEEWNAHRHKYRLYELLAILIGSGNTEESAVELMRRLLLSCDNNLNTLRKENKIPVVFPYRKLKVSSLGNFSFKRLKLKFPTGETIVSLPRNQRFQCMVHLLPAVFTLGVAVLLLGIPFCLFSFTPILLYALLAKVPMYETIGFAVLIYSHISILVHNREDTIVLSV